MAFDPTFRIGDQVIGVGLAEDSDYFGLTGTLKQIVDGPAWLIEYSGLADLEWVEVEYADPDGPLTINLTGIYGAPLQFVIDRLEASGTFAAFSPDKTIYLHGRISGSISDGDTWAEIGYAKGGHSISRNTAGAGVAAFTPSRKIEVAIVRAYDSISENDEAYIVNIAGAIVEDILANADGEAITEITLQEFGYTKSTTPMQLGCSLTLEVGV